MDMETILDDNRQAEEGSFSYRPMPCQWPRVPLPRYFIYHFNIIYNHAHCPLTRTEDTDFALEVTMHMVKQLEKAGYVNSYFFERDRRLGNIFSAELERVLRGSFITFLLLTPGFLQDCLPHYLQIIDFKKWLRYLEMKNRLVTICIGVGVDEAMSCLPIRHAVNFDVQWNRNQSSWDHLISEIALGMSYSPRPIGHSQTTSERSLSDYKIAQNKYTENRNYLEGCLCLDCERDASYSMYTSRGSYHTGSYQRRNDFSYDSQIFPSERFCEYCREDSYHVPEQPSNSEYLYNDLYNTEISTQAQDSKQYLSPTELTLDYRVHESSTFPYNSCRELTCDHYHTSFGHKDKYNELEFNSHQFNRGQRQETDFSDDEDQLGKKIKQILDREESEWEELEETPFRSEYRADEEYEEYEYMYNSNDETDTKETQLSNDFTGLSETQRILQKTRDMLSTAYCSDGEEKSRPSREKLNYRQRQIYSHDEMEAEKANESTHNSWKNNRKVYTERLFQRVPKDAELQKLRRRIHMACPPKECSNAYHEYAIDVRRAVDTDVPHYHICEKCGTSYQFPRAHVRPREYQVCRNSSFERSTRRLSRSHRSRSAPVQDSELLALRESYQRIYGNFREIPTRYAKDDAYLWRHDRYPRSTTYQRDSGYRRSRSYTRGYDSQRRSRSDTRDATYTRPSSYRREKDYARDDIHTRDNIHRSGVVHTIDAARDVRDHDYVRDHNYIRGDIHRREEVYRRDVNFYRDDRQTRDEEHERYPVESRQYVQEPERYSRKDEYKRETKKEYDYSEQEVNTAYDADTKDEVYRRDEEDHITYRKEVVCDRDDAYKYQNNIQVTTKATEKSSSEMKTNVDSKYSETISNVKNRTIDNTESSENRTVSNDDDSYFTNQRSRVRKMKSLGYEPETEETHYDRPTYTETEEYKSSQIIDSEPQSQQIIEFAASTNHIIESGDSYKVDVSKVVNVSEEEGLVSVETDQESKNVGTVVVVDTEIIVDNTKSDESEEKVENSISYNDTVADREVVRWENVTEENFVREREDSYKVDESKMGLISGEQLPVYVDSFQDSRNVETEVVDTETIVEKTESFESVEKMEESAHSIENETNRQIMSSEYVISENSEEVFVSEPLPANDIRTETRHYEIVHETAEPGATPREDEHPSDSHSLPPVTDVAFFSPRSGTIETNSGYYGDFLLTSQTSETLEKIEENFTDEYLSQDTHEIEETSEKEIAHSEEAKEIDEMAEGSSSIEWETKEKEEKTVLEIRVLDVCGILEENTENYDENLVALWISQEIESIESEQRDVKDLKVEEQETSMTETVQIEIQTKEDSETHETVTHEENLDTMKISHEIVNTETELRDVKDISTEEQETTMTEAFQIDIENKGESETQETGVSEENLDVFKISQEIVSSESQQGQVKAMAEEEKETISTETYQMDVQNKDESQTQEIVAYEENLDALKISQEVEVRESEQSDVEELNNVEQETSVTETYQIDIENKEESKTPETEEFFETVESLEQIHTVEGSETKLVESTEDEGSSVDAWQETISVTQTEMVSEIQSAGTESEMSDQENYSESVEQFDLSSQDLSTSAENAQQFQDDTYDESLTDVSAYDEKTDQEKSEDDVKPDVYQVEYMEYIPERKILEYIEFVKEEITYTTQQVPESRERAVSGNVQSGAEQSRAGGRREVVMTTRSLFSDDNDTHRVTLTQEVLPGEGMARNEEQGSSVDLRPNEYAVFHVTQEESEYKNALNCDPLEFLHDKSIGITAKFEDKTDFEGKSVALLDLAQYQELDSKPDILKDVNDLFLRTREKESQFTDDFNTFKRGMSYKERTHETLLDVTDSFAFPSKASFKKQVSMSEKQDITMIPIFDQSQSETVPHPAFNFDRKILDSDEQNMQGISNTYELRSEDLGETTGLFEFTSSQVATSNTLTIAVDTAQVKDNVAYHKEAETTQKLSESVASQNTSAASRSVQQVAYTSPSAVATHTKDSNAFMLIRKVPCSLDKEKEIADTSVIASSASHAHTFKEKEINISSQIALPISYACTPAFTTCTPTLTSTQASYACITTTMSTTTTPMSVVIPLTSIVTDTVDSCSHDYCLIQEEALVSESFTNISEGSDGDIFNSYQSKIEPKKEERICLATGQEPEVYKSGTTGYLKQEHSEEEHCSQMGSWSSESHCFETFTSHFTVTTSTTTTTTTTTTTSTSSTSLTSGTTATTTVMSAQGTRCSLGDWLLPVYKGICHTIAKPDMPYMG